VARTIEGAERCWPRISDAASLLETRMLRQQLRRKRRSFRCWRLELLLLVISTCTRQSAWCAAERQISDDASAALRRIRDKHYADARLDSENAEADLRARNASRRRLVTLAMNAS